MRVPFKLRCWKQYRAREPRKNGRSRNKGAADAGKRGVVGGVAAEHGFFGEKASCRCPRRGDSVAVNSELSLSNGPGDPHPITGPPAALRTSVRLLWRTPLGRVLSR